MRLLIGYVFIIMTVEDIKKPVKEEMALLEKIQVCYESDVALLDKITIIL